MAKTYFSGKMELKMWNILVLTGIILKICDAYDRQFLKMENCTSSGRTMVIHECLIKDNKVNVRVTVLPANKNNTNIKVGSVSKKYQIHNFIFFSKVLNFTNLKKEFLRKYSSYQKSEDVC